MNLIALWNRIQKYLPPFIRNDLARKAAALLLAAMVCNYFYGYKGEIVMLDEVPVSVRLPSGYTIGNLKPTVRLGVRVPRRGGHLDAQDVVSREVVVPASGIAQDGEATRIPLSRESFGVPLGYHVETVTPEELLLNIDRYDTREIRVDPVFDGDVAAGYNVQSVSVEPAKVSVTAPDSLLKNLTAIRTERIKLSGIEQSFESYISLEPQGKGVKPAREKVLVKVEIRKKTRGLTFTGMEIVIFQGNSRDIRKVELLKNRSANVWVVGDAAAVECLQREEIKVFADVSHVDQPGVYHVDLGCWISASGIRVHKLSPKSIQVKVTK